MSDVADEQIAAVEKRTRLSRAVTAALYESGGGVTAAEALDVLGFTAMTIVCTFAVNPPELWKEWLDDQAKQPIEQMAKMASGIKKEGT